MINASSSDVNAVQGTDTIPDGISVASLSISIIDDTLPEFIESFIVALTTISGGADLGSPIITTVTIPTSDDPYGAFGQSFAYNMNVHVLNICTVTVCMLN